MSLQHQRLTDVLVGREGGPGSFLANDELLIIEADAFDLKPQNPMIMPANARTL